MCCPKSCWSGAAFCVVINSKSDDSAHTKSPIHTWGFLDSTAKYYYVYFTTPPDHPLRVLFPDGKRDWAKLFKLSLFFLFLLLFLLYFRVRKEREKEERKTNQNSPPSKNFRIMPTISSAVQARVAAERKAEAPRMPRT